MVFSILINKKKSFCKNNIFQTEILGPNKDVTNIDVEIKEAEEFLTTDQLNIIRSIVDDETELLNNDEATVETTDWDRLGLRPTLESLGLRPKYNENSNDNYDNDENSIVDSIHDDNNDKDEIIVGEVVISTIITKACDLDNNLIVANETGMFCFDFFFLKF
jgi:hypothetical protein